MNGGCSSLPNLCSTPSSCAAVSSEARVRKTSRTMRRFSTCQSSGYGAEPSSSKSVNTWSATRSAASLAATAQGTSESNGSRGCASRRSMCSRPSRSSTSWTSEPRCRGSSSSTSEMSSCSRTRSTYLNRYCAGHFAQVSRAVADSTAASRTRWGLGPTLPSQALNSSPERVRIAASPRPRSGSCSTSGCCASAMDGHARSERRSCSCNEAGGSDDRASSASNDSIIRSFEARSSSQGDG